jgi:hypothetical protein
MRHIIALAALVLSIALPATAQDRPIRVAVDEFPPYAVRSEDGAWFGLAVDAWRLIAESEGWQYEFVDGGPALDALRDGAADLALPVLATPELAAEFALTPPVHTATLGVAGPTRTAVMNVLSGIMTWDFLRLLLGLSALLLVVGALVWLLERKANGDQFSGKTVHGLGDGFWWAGVTLTTIGYGDKAPVTVAGRTVAMLWMLMGLAVSAALTATVVTLTGLQSGNKSLDGLRDTAVAVAEDSGTARYLASRDFDLRSFATLADAVAAFNDDESIGAVAGPSQALSAAVAASDRPDRSVDDTNLSPSLIVIAAADRTAANLVGPAVLDLMTRDAGWRIVDNYIEGR